MTIVNLSWLISRFYKAVKTIGGSAFLLKLSILQYKKVPNLSPLKTFAVHFFSMNKNYGG